MAFAFIISAVSCSFAKEVVKHPCTRDEARHAEEDTDHLTDWNHVYRSYQEFSHCDDGAIAEGYSDAVGKLLADKWDDFGSLVKLASKDGAFQRFVVKHIDGTIPSDTLAKIVANAKTRCPPAHARFCRLIVASASP